MAIEALGALAGVPTSGVGGATRSLSMLPQGDGGAAAEKFGNALAKASDAHAVGSTGGSPTMQGISQMLDRVDLQAKSVSDYAAQASVSGGTMTPGEIVNLTMKCQEFMFQCQLTSNIANRSSDGVQQLFRQQS